MRISDWSSDVCSSDLAFAGEEVCREVPDLQGRSGHRFNPSSLKARVQDVAPPVADQVDSDDSDQQGDAGKERDLVLAGEQVIIAVGDQQTARWRGERDPAASEHPRR